MAIITPYQHQPRALSFEASAYVPLGRTAEERTVYERHYGQFIELLGGYDPYTRTVTPMYFYPEQDCHHYLDSMTGAVEAGLVDDEHWVEQLWQSPADLDAFLAVFSDYDMYLRIVDRWWQMLSLLTRNVNEEGMVTSLELATSMARAAAEQTGEFDVVD